MNLVIIGAGGLAREVFDLAHICYADHPGFSVKGFLSDSPSDIADMGYPPVLGTVDGYEIQPHDVFFCGIGKVTDRKRTVEIISGKGGQFLNLIHPTAILSPSAKVGIGVAIKAYCSLSSDVKVGDFTYLQSSVILGHDVQIGRYCQVNSFAFFAGHVKVHDLCTISAGANLIQNVVVEEQAIVGMGSVVLNRVKAGTTVFGMPARKIHGQ